MWTQLSPAVLKTFLYFLMRANFKPAKWFDGYREVDIPAGSFATSYATVAADCRLTVKQVRDAFEDLESLRIAAYTREQQYTLVKVLNYRRYNPFAVDPGRKSGQVPAEAPVHSQGAAPTAECVQKPEYKQGTLQGTDQGTPPPPPKVNMVCGLQGPPGDPGHRIGHRTGHLQGTREEYKEYKQKISNTQAVVKTSTAGALFEEWIGVFLAAGVKLSDRDRDKAARGTGSVPGFFSFEEPEHREIVEYTKAKAKATEARYMGLPVNMLDRREWKRKGGVRTLPAPHRASRSEQSTEDAARNYFTRKYGGDQTDREGRGDF